MGEQDDGPKPPRRSGSGLQLNKEWSIGAAQAYYHKGGTWFNLIDTYPAALCDQNGYVFFRNRQELMKHAAIKIGSNIWVHDGISKLPGYVRKRG